MTTTESVLLTFGITISLFWLGMLYCVFIIEHYKGSKQYYWIKRHVLTDEDIEPYD
jgi:hypothetical protein